MLTEELIRATIDERRRQVEQIRYERAAEAQLDKISLAGRVLGLFHRRGVQHGTSHRRRRRYQTERKLAPTQGSDFEP